MQWFVYRAINQLSAIERNYRMSAAVEISFDCLPLRSVTRFDVPLDASPEYEALVRRVKQAVEKHGVHNTYHLYNAKCVFRLTNSDDVGMIEFGFDGTALTDADDMKTRSVDIDVQLKRETCDWLIEPVVQWFADTVKYAARVEFDRFITAGDLHRTIERIEKLRAESDSHDGFVGMGL
jgi:hypothetical protein